MKTITKNDWQETKYRILKSDGKFLGANRDDLPSWFSLQKARELVDYSSGERIIEHNGMDILWEVL